VSEQIYVWKNEQKLGPYLKSEIASRIESGEFSRDDQFWQPGTSGWTKLAELFPARRAEAKNAAQAAQPPAQAQHRSRGYWAGYLYAAFWGFVTYSSATHALATLLTVQSIPTEVGARAEFLTKLVLWPVLTVVFGWVTYRLLVRKVGMKMIYVLVCVHAANVLAEGIVPWKLVFWIVLSAIVVAEFRERERRMKAQS
jgi:hypothetical protein